MPMTIVSIPDDETKAPERDFIELDGFRSPGRATVVKAGCPFKWDERGGYALDGAALYPMGGKLSSFDVLIDLWTEEHWAEWKEFAKGALQQRRAKPFGKSIRHPLLNREPLLIKDVVIEDVSQFEQDEHGLWTCAISLKAYRSPREIVVAAASPTPAIGPRIPTARDKAEELQQKLLNQIGELL